MECLQCARCGRPMVNNSHFVACGQCHAALADAAYLIGRKVDNWVGNPAGHIFLQHVYQQVRNKWEACAAQRPISRKEPVR